MHEKPEEYQNIIDDYIDSDTDNNTDNNTGSDTPDNKATTFRIGKYEFHTKSEYIKGRQDIKKIQELGVEQINTYSVAEQILDRMEDENIVFECVVGYEYVEFLQNVVKNHEKKMLYRCIQIACCIIVLFCIGFFSVNGLLEYKSRKNMTSLQQLVEERKKSAQVGNWQEDQQMMNIDNDSILGQNVSQDSASQDSVSQDGISQNRVSREHIQQNTSNDGKEEKAYHILPQYEELHKANPDFVGWLTIEGTDMNYPVMQSLDNEYYLSHNIEKKYDKNGMLILDNRCNLQSDYGQFLVYGHNVQSGRMFGELMDYQEEAYYKYHQELQFDTIYDSSVYEIVAVFYAKGDTNNKNEHVKDDSKAFFQHTEFTSEKEYDRYIKECKAKSLYDTGVTPAYGSPLVALITCEYNMDNGRFVVLAARRGANGI